MIEKVYELSTSTIKVTFGLILFGLIIWGCSNTASSNFNRELDQLNTSVNIGVSYRSYTPYTQGHPFVVHEGIKEGDCTELQGLKALKLVRNRFFTSKDLKPLVVFDPYRGVNHLLLIAKDKYVFDNNSNIVYDYESIKSRYTFVDMSDIDEQLVQQRYQILFNNLLTKLEKEMIQKW